MYNGEVDALEPREVRQVLEATAGLSHRKELTVRALLETGMRASELAHIKLGWFLDDRDPPAIQVPAHEPCDCNQCRESAERNLERWATADVDEDRPGPGTQEYEELLERRVAETWHPKSSAGERKIPVNDRWVWENLMEHVEEHGGFSAGRTGIWYRVRAVDDELDLPKPLSPHVCRHTYGTGMARGGAKLENLREMMGHSSIENTSVYLHPNYDDDVGPDSKRAVENRGW